MKRSASKFKGKTKGIKEHTFTFDPQMNRKWMMSRLAFIEYAGREYGSNAKASLKKGAKTIVTPSRPKTYIKIEYTALQGTQELDNYRMAYKNYLSTEDNLSAKMGKLYDCLWGQCDPALQNKLKSDKRFDAADEISDVLTLLSIIDTICSSNNTVDYYPLKCVAANSDKAKECLQLNTIKSLPCY